MYAVVLGIGLPLAISPGWASIHLCGMKYESRLWVRILGLLAIAWVALGIVGDPHFTAITASADLRKLAQYLQQQVFGALLGFAVALYTQGIERRGSASS
jgi:hypothetical protein